MSSKHFNEIDINFNVFSDARGGDPDKTSPTLRRYHKLLWSKPLPSGKIFTLADNQPKCYLHHQSELGEFRLGSDAITNSYRDQRRKQWLINQVRLEAQELFDSGSTIGAYILFPNNSINGKQTINQARGVNPYIDDRFDMTLECIRRWYLGESSPLFEVLTRYHNFFDLFGTFQGYVDFFLLQDLLDNRGSIQFFLPFDNFQSKPNFEGVDAYTAYKQRVVDFITSRNGRILSWLEK